MKKIVFVCTGNICRSPIAEGVFNKLAKENNIDVIASSKGIEGYHKGEKPDYRAIAIANKNNVKIENIIANQISINDIKDSDYIFTVTQKHKEKLLKIVPEFENKIHNLLDFVKLESVESVDIKDPYYGTNQDFAEVFEIINEACKKLIKILKNA